ncbi:hypothetical protein Q3G72_018108 [Acer saccharum]|nr:hypothetical protein Q3G72_018108 [Acer saccharum]
MFFSTIVFSDDNRLILMGLTGVPESMKVWEVKGELLEDLREIGEMSEDVLEKLKGSKSCEVSLVTCLVWFGLVWFDDDEYGLAWFEFEFWLGLVWFDGWGF